MDRPDKCYTDGRKCSGARFYFCDDCLKAIRGRDFENHPPKTPLINTLNHIPDKENHHG